MRSRRLQLREKEEKSTAEHGRSGEGDSPADSGEELSEDALAFLALLVHGGPPPGILIRPNDCIPPCPRAVQQCRTMEAYIALHHAVRQLPFEVVGSTLVGRRCVATSSIPDGTFLFAEQPIGRVKATPDKIANAAVFAMEQGNSPLLVLVQQLCDSTPSDFVVEKIAKSKKLQKQLGKQKDSNVAQLMGIYLSNSHSMVATGEAGIFPLTAMLNHSCSANCVFSVDDEGTMFVATTREVNKGEELTVQYIEVDGEMPVSDRRRELQESFHFKCMCDLCVTQSRGSAGLSARRKRQKRGAG